MEYYAAPKKNENTLNILIGKVFEDILVSQKVHIVENGEGIRPTSVFALHA